MATATFPDGSIPEAIDVARIAANLFAAGQETTVRLFGTALQRIGDDQELQQLLREHREHIPNFVEECLRIESPVKGDFRLARVTTELGGVKIPAGTTLMVVNGAANRDPGRFEQPTEFQVERANARQHLAFGHGAHTCPGAPLARAEGRITIERLLDRMDDIRISDKEHGPAGARRYDYVPTYILRGVSRLHLMLAVTACVCSLALMLGGASAGASAASPGVTPATGGGGVPVVPGFTSFDPAVVGYEQSEVFLSGTATAYTMTAPVPNDGKYTAVVTSTAPYTTRAVVMRPINRRRFNGTVVVEWLNVSGGADAGPDWMLGHNELVREGFVWVGVSAQKVGVDALKSADPTRGDAVRYANLSHPGDNYSYDIFRQAGQAIRDDAPHDARRTEAQARHRDR